MGQSEGPYSPRTWGQCPRACGPLGLIGTTFSFSLRNCCYAAIRYENEKVVPAHFGAYFFYFLCTTGPRGQWPRHFSGQGRWREMEKRGFLTALLSNTYTDQFREATGQPHWSSGLLRLYNFVKLAHFRAFRTELTTKMKGHFSG